MAPKEKGRGSRVTVLGDACHPMSMFKGQGANQVRNAAIIHNNNVKFNLT